METRSGRRIYPVIDSEENRLQQYRNDRDTLVSKLKPGDHIAAKRRMLRSYEHHGIYEGEKNGYQSVIHFQGPLKKGSSSRSQITCTECGYEHPKKGKVVTSCIDCFSQGKTMFKMQYMLQKRLLSHKDDADWIELEPGQLIIQGYRQKKYYLEHYKKGRLHGHSRSVVPTQKRKRSSCQYTLENQVRLYQMYSSISRSSEQVLEEARKYTAGTSSPPYSLICNNCEHFAVFCMTGKKNSPQINKLYLTFFCKLGKCLTPSCGTSNSGINGHEHEHEEDDEENTLLENPISKKIKFQ